ncbi:hypothetical protein OSB04_028740 [Centaurea solstitialis]|uniref:SWIM-type domain-containing protein n=1 Tax=Centaurea solstitialis TaxID=347529 RepID=A0AA38SG81_9ASTR|nr:hypothetical protein OSB04_028740 [Centaurea solstitialis]
MITSYLITVHHDGCFMYLPLRYENGSSIDISITRVSIEEITSLIEKETSSVVNALYWCLPGNDLANGLMKIENEGDIQTMFDFGESYGHINVYIDHFGDDMSDYIVNHLKLTNDQGDGGGSQMQEQVEEKVKEDEAGLEEDEAGEEDDSDSDLDYDVGEEDDSDANSLDHLSEEEEEVAETRRVKAKGKNVASSKKQRFGREDDGKGNENEDIWKEEHEEFMEDLLKALKSDQGDENDENDEGHEDNARYPIHDPSTHWKMKKPVVGERFESQKQFKDCMTYYALANGYSIWYEVSASNRVIARCGNRPERMSNPSKGKQRKTKRYSNPDGKHDNKCPWRCYARLMTNEDSFQVISMNDFHSCCRDFEYGSLINYKWIGKEFGHRIRMNPEIKLADIAALVMKKYKCQVTLNQCRRAKMWAINVYEKSLVEHYGLLRSYGDEILRSNPGSTVKLDVTTNPDGKVYFDRFYVCLQALKEGWMNGCRRIIAIDGCFLKGVCQGELITAIGRDGNNHIFPIAWAVINVENKENWTWFLGLLGEDLEIEQGEGLTLMSDQHKGLLEAVKDVMPYAEHRQCARHIYENFRKQFTGVEFRNLFWKAAKASYQLEYERVMDQIKAANPNAYDYLVNKDPKVVRSKPIITMLEAIRVIIMERMEKMRRISDGWASDICPTIIRKLQQAKTTQRYWDVLPGGVRLFEVRNGHDAFIVDEENHNCTCRMWQLSGIPCPHAVAAIYFLNKRPEDYVPNWFRKEMYKVTYGSYLQPVQGMNQWPPNYLNKPLPPKPRIMPGRPKKKRRRSAHEPVSHVGRVSRVGTIMTCTKCGGLGHNIRGCKNQVQKPSKTATKKPIGRPKKVIKDAAMDKGKAMDKEKGAAVDKGKGAAVDKGKGAAVDKGKGAAVDFGKGAAVNQAPVTNVGGFMADARKSYKDPTQPSQGKKKALQPAKGKAHLVPLRRQAAARIAKINMEKKISGPGSNSNQPMDLD